MGRGDGDALAVEIPALAKRNNGGREKVGGLTPVGLLTERLQEDIKYGTQLAKLSYADTISTRNHYPPGVYHVGDFLAEHMNKAEQSGIYSPELIAQMKKEVPANYQNNATVEMHFTHSGELVLVASQRESKRVGKGKWVGRRRFKPAVYYRGTDAKELFATFEKMEEALCSVLSYDSSTNKYRKNRFKGDSYSSLVRAIATARSERKRAVEAGVEI